MKNLKDLKNFKGNLRGADFGLFPKDTRNHNLKSIPKLSPDQVNVVALLESNSKTRDRQVICSVADLPDTDQQEFIHSKIRQIRETAALKETSSAAGEGERTLSTLIKKYLVEVAPEKKSAWDIRARLTVWEEKLGSKTLAEITPADISAIKRQLNQTRSGATVNRFLGVLSAVFSYAIRELHWIETNPLSQVQKFKENNDRIRWLNDEERQQLFSGLEKSESRELKDLVIFCLATGCRKGEALGLTWDDIDFENHSIEFKSVRRRVLCSEASIDEKTGEVNLSFKKNQNDAGLKNKSKIKKLSIDDVAFHPLVLILMERKFGLQSESNFVFPHDPRHAWQNLIKRTGLKDFKFHDLRHTCASYAIQAGKTLLEVAVQLGHESLVSAKRYAHHDPQANVGTGAAVASRLFSSNKSLYELNKEGTFNIG